MPEEVASTWATRELPILRAALRRLDDGELLVDLDDVRQETGLSPMRELRPGLEALRAANPPYIEVEFTGGWSEDSAGGIITSVSERARRELGSWPSAEHLVEQLAQALSEAADREEEPQRKGRLREAADALRSFARDVAVGVISDRIGRF